MDAIPSVRLTLGVGISKVGISADLDVVVVLVGVLLTAWLLELRLFVVVTAGGANTGSGELYL